MKKRGLSGVITSMLLIVLGLVAIGIVWVVISNVLSSTAGDIETTSKGFFDNLMGRDRVWESVTGLVTWENDSNNIWCENCNVGIGTTSPSYKLSFGSALEKKIALFEADAANFWGFGISAGTMEMWTNDGIRMVIKDSGNVGIGTTVPGYKLHVAGATDIVDVQGATNAFYRATNKIGAAAATGDFSFGVDDGSSAGANAFIIYDRINSAYRFVLNNAGNVGIGTTSPTSKLHVIGKATFTGGVDPPYISFSDESHESIQQYAKEVEEHEKVMQFWNGEEHRIEVYVISEDRFYTITGELIEE